MIRLFPPEGSVGGDDERGEYEPGYRWCSYELYPLRPVFSPGLSGCGLYGIAQRPCGHIIYDR